MINYRVVETLSYKQLERMVKTVTWLAVARAECHKPPLLLWFTVLSEHNKKRAILYNQLRPVSLKDLINWLIGFWCNQEVIRVSGSHVVHSCIFVLIDAANTITAHVSPGTCDRLATTCPYTEVKNSPINFLQFTYCYGRRISSFFRHIRENFHN
jgi:hypothetical protein